MAHKKGAGSTPQRAKLQRSETRHEGLRRRSGWAREHPRAPRSASSIHAGHNVGVAKDYSLFALVDAW